MTAERAAPSGVATAACVGAFELDAEGLAEDDAALPRFESEHASTNERVAAMADAAEPNRI
ncbi:MAG: hypothetical protein HOW73_10130 [Polyangiaceae bacterium]|nr:hypothetical protein [Polyangiaceae bacterium]